MILSLVIVLALVLAGCGDDGGGDSDGASDDAGGGTQPQPGGSVSVGIGEDVPGFNPATDRVNFPAQSVYRAIYDPIAVIDTEGVAQPYLVEAFEANEDFTEWTITMRDGINFHNGDPLTPQILANHIKTMQLGALTFFTFKPVNAVGVVDEAAGPQHEAGEISDEEYDVLRRQVKVFMSEPWSTFPAFLAAYQVGYVAHPDYMDGTVEDPIGTGPFVFDEWVPGDHITASKNEDYWREGLPYLDEVEFRPLTDPNSRYLALESGDIDMMITNAPTQVSELGSAGVPEGQVVIEEQGAGDEQLVILNTQSGPTSDIRVRKALQLATDRAAINDSLYGGYFELADSPYAESSHWWSDPGWPDPDIDEASSLVEEWEAENGELTIELTAFDNNDDLTLAQLLQAQWAEAGVDTQINTTSQSAIAEFVPVGNYEALQSPFFNGADPDEHYPFWDPDPENIGGPGELSINFSRYTSDITREALHAGRQSSDVAERETEYAKVWKDWAENVPYLFIYHTKHLLIATDQVQGLEAFTTPEGDPAATFFSGSVFMTQMWRVG